TLTHSAEALGPLGARSWCRARSRITRAESLTTRQNNMPTIAGLPMPGRLHFGGHQVDVLETLDQWPGPNYRYINARSTEGNLYILRFDEHQPTWELIMFKGARAQMRKDRT